MKGRNMISRRLFLGGTAGAAVFTLAGWHIRGDTTEADAAEAFEVTKSDAEWRKILSPEAYEVMRKEGTERAFSSPLNDEHRKGAFHCAGCDLPLFVSETKFESGTGWPSFYQPLPNAVGTRTDRSLLLLSRTEVHCRRCGGHLGHVFNDGPKPTGLRYCMNGVALRFVEG